MSSDSCKGRLTLTKPINTLAILWSDIVSSIAQQLEESNFEHGTGSRKLIREGKAIRFSDEHKVFFTDGYVRYASRQNLVVVLEFVSQENEEAARRKAQHYFLDVTTRVNFVVLIILARRPSSGAEGGQDVSPITGEEYELDTNYDNIYVHVFRSVYEKDSVTGEMEILRPKCVIDRLEVFHECPTEEDTFQITWADMKCGKWPEFCKKVDKDRSTLEPV